MLLFADHRGFLTAEERHARCLYCGKHLVVLPADRRGGYCFDCLPWFGPDPVGCPSCFHEIPGERREAGCSACGWHPVEPVIARLR